MESEHYIIFFGYGKNFITQIIVKSKKQKRGEVSAKPELNNLLHKYI